MVRGYVPRGGAFERPCIYCTSICVCMYMHVLHSVHVVCDRHSLFLLLSPPLILHLHPLSFPSSQVGQVFPQSDFFLLLIFFILFFISAISFSFLLRLHICTCTVEVKKKSTFRLRTVFITVCVFITVARALCILHFHCFFTPSPAAVVYIVVYSCVYSTYMYMYSHVYMTVHLFFLVHFSPHPPFPPTPYFPSLVPLLPLLPSSSLSLSLSLSVSLSLSLFSAVCGSTLLVSGCWLVSWAGFSTTCPSSLYLGNTPLWICKFNPICVSTCIYT